MYYWLILKIFCNCTSIPMWYKNMPMIHHPVFPACLESFLFMLGKRRIPDKPERQDRRACFTVNNIILSHSYKFFTWRYFIFVWWRLLDFMMFRFSQLKSSFLFLDVWAFPPRLDDADCFSRCFSVGAPGGLSACMQKAGGNFAMG